MEGKYITVSGTVSEPLIAYLPLAEKSKVVVPASVDLVASRSSLGWRQIYSLLTRTVTKSGALQGSRTLLILLGRQTHDRYVSNAKTRDSSPICAALGIASGLEDGRSQGLFTHTKIGRSVMLLIGLQPDFGYISPPVLRPDKMVEDSGIKPLTDGCRPTVLSLALIPQEWRSVEESNLSGQGCSLSPGRSANASKWWDQGESNP